MIRLLWKILSFTLVVVNTGWAAPIDDARLKGLAWLISHQNGDGSWRNTPGLEMIETAAAVEALANAGVTSGFVFNRGVAWLLNHQAHSHDALAKQIIALSKAGRDVNDLVEQLISGRNDVSLGWGAYAKYSGSFPDTALAMDAIKVSGFNYGDTGYGLGFILAKQNSDGGWPYSKGDIGSPPSRILPTAYTLLTLIHYKSMYNVQDDINEGIAWLKSQQKAGGGFGDGTVGTTLETALAYNALVAELGGSDSAAVSAQNFLLGQQHADGSWGESNAWVTLATLTTLPSVNLTDTDQDGLPDGVETVALLGTDPNVSDSQLLVKGNGQSVTGITTAQMLPQAYLNQPYTVTLPAEGTPPHSWTLSGPGRLPEGLSLDVSTGAISGTPVQLGTFNFGYRVAASETASSAFAQINVEAVVSSHQVPAMPMWGTFVLVLSVLGIAVIPGFRFHLNRH